MKPLPPPIDLGIPADFRRRIVATATAVLRDWSEPVSVGAFIRGGCSELGLDRLCGEVSRRIHPHPDPTDVQAVLLQSERSVPS